VHFDVGDPPFEAGKALLDLLLEPRVAVIVARHLVVGMNLDKQDTLSVTGS
jgi:hypothetical protein